MNLSSYRNVIIFYKVLPDKTTKPYADIYPYCKDKVTIPFKSTNKLSKKLTMLKGVKQGLDVKDIDVKSGLYPIESNRTCFEYEMWNLAKEMRLHEGDSPSWI